MNLYDMKESFEKSPFLLSFYICDLINLILQKKCSLKSN